MKYTQNEKMIHRPLTSFKIILDTDVNYRFLDKIRNRTTRRSASIDKTREETR